MFISNEIQPWLNLSSCEMSIYMLTLCAMPSSLPQPQKLLYFGLWILRAWVNITNITEIIYRYKTLGTLEIERCFKVSSWHKTQTTTSLCGKFTPYRSCINQSAQWLTFSLATYSCAKTCCLDGLNLAPKQRWFYHISCLQEAICPSTTILHKGLNCEP